MGDRENIRQDRQKLVTPGEVLTPATQESFGLLTLGGCTASLLRNNWAITAAHCVEVGGATNNQVPDPARPGQFMLNPLASISVTANWGGGQTKQAVQIETFRPYDVAIVRVGTPFNVHGSTSKVSPLIFRDDQFPYWGEEVPVGITVFGRGINQFAKAATATEPAKISSGDGQFRVGFATTSSKEANLYWFSSATGTFIAGGDSGGPSYAWVLSGYALMGVHASSKTVRVPGMVSNNRWDWVSGTPESADAPIKAVWSQIEAVIGPATSDPDPALEPPPPGYIGTLDSAVPRPKLIAMQAFRHRASAAVKAGFAAGFPNFYEATRGLDHIGGTVFIKSTVVEWRNVPLSDLGSVALDDFEERLRLTNAYATRNGFVGGFPNFFHADYGKGVVCGTMLLKSDGAEWRDVPISELGNPALDDFSLRFRATQDYAKRNGFVGGFPNLFHAEKQVTDFQTGRRSRRTVCGTILLKPGTAEWRDVFLYRGPA